MIRQLAGMPTDNLGPADYALLDTLVGWAEREVARWDRRAKRKAEGDKARQERFERATFAWFTQSQGYAAVDRRSGGVCECPDGCGQRATVHHHIAGQQGIDDPHNPDNLLHLSQLCHERIHGHPEQSYADGTMRKRVR